MADKYNVEAIINDLQKEPKMVPDKHDGCYQLMRETVTAYSKLSKLSELDYRDLDLIYLTTVLTRDHSIALKKGLIDNSHLSPQTKDSLKALWDDVWEKAGNGAYDNTDSRVENGQSIGLFGRAFSTFRRPGATPSSEQVQAFIRMLIELLPMNDDDEIFKCAEKLFQKRIPGMRAGVASMILHCLKPYAFPVLNNSKSKQIYIELGVRLANPERLDGFIQNCRTIKAFRDQNFSYMNYRIFDKKAQELDKYKIGNSPQKPNDAEHPQGSAPFESQVNEAQEVQQQVYPLNTILYGPPGTGKTYHTAIYAVAILTPDKTLDDVREMPYEKVMDEYKKLKKDGRIAFTTFHQSYGYEDFIEGIRPVITDGVEQNEPNIIYSIEPGIFKAFCDSAHEDKDAQKQFSDAWEAMVESIHNNADKPYIFTRKTGNTFSATLANPDRLRVVWTGGTYNDLKEEKTYRQWLGEYDRSRLTGGNKWEYDAIQAVIDELIAKFKLPSKPTKPGSQNRVFIIDEINRGNISKIFGELITLIEESKRAGNREEMSVTLPYSHKPFSVPNNVYILGTMNTADRSIALLDTALRRRFSFIEMMPDTEALNGIKVEGINISKMLEVLNQRIEVLYDREHTIGHAYFMTLTSESKVEDLGKIFREKIIPLLQEYFYDDYEKIRLVLGDSKRIIKNNKHKFILTDQETIDDKKPTDIKSLFGDINSDYDFTDQVTYRINTKAFDEIESYRKIYESGGSDETESNHDY